MTFTTLNDYTTVRNLLAWLVYDEEAGMCVPRCVKVEVCCEERMCDTNGSKDIKNGICVVCVCFASS